MQSNKKVFILGANGFIGSALSWRILIDTNWEVFAVDISDNKLGNCIGKENFHFFKKNVLEDSKWIEETLKNCDVVLPLVAIATPSLYVQDPLRVYNLDYESNVEIVKLCAKYKKRIVFPSTSEVYGLCSDEEFDEYKSNLVLGPIEKERWIYSCIKQMLDRVIWAYGKHQGLQFTLFRPFNFIGPKLDDITSVKEGSSRVLTQFTHNILNGKPIKLVDGGLQKRSFTFIDDGIDCLMKILENKNSVADGKIFNIGNPAEEFSIKQLAETLIELFADYPDYASYAKNAKIENVSATDYYGEAYQDVSRRVPSIKQAQTLLGWNPKTDFKSAIKFTLDYHLLKKDYELERIKR